MSYESASTNPYPQPYAGYDAPPSNPLGVAGFVVSLAGIVVTLGFLSPIGLILSLIGLTKAPRGFAIAGSVIGLFGTLLAGGVILAVIGAFGTGWSLSQAFTGQSTTSSNMWNASYEIDNLYSAANDTLPDEATGTAAVNSHFDEWGTALTYRPIAGDQYELISAGPDLQFNTSDDYTETHTAVGSGFSPTVQQAQPFQQTGPDATQIEFSFNQAALTFASQFPAGSDRPDQATGQTVANTLRDAWGRPMQYQPTPDSPFYQLKSAGPDGVANNSDDIVRSFFFEGASNP